MSAAPAIDPAYAASLRAAHEQETAAARPARDTEELTPRELEVLRLVADGTTRARIARRLFVSEDTVKTHLQRLYRKLGATDRASAVHQAHLRGLL